MWDDSSETAFGVMVSSVGIPRRDTPSEVHQCLIHQVRYRYRVSFNWKTYDVAGFTYQADNYCPGCAAAALGWSGSTEPEAFEYLRSTAVERGIDMDDLHSYDSGDYPKPIYVEQIENDEECGGCGGPLLG